MRPDDYYTKTVNDAEQFERYYCDYYYEEDDDYDPSYEENDLDSFYYQEDSRMSLYNPELISDRRALAEAILFKLSECGFTEDTFANGERVFYREVPNTERKVVVYTTIVRDAVRSVGEDAIRISGVHKNSKGNWLGLIKNTRVNRTGTIDSIVDRMYCRMRETYGKIMKTPESCHCGAPKFISKKGNYVCSEFCWDR